MKVRYEVDPHNRLVLDDPAEASDLPKFRKVLDGEFKTDAFNNLSYRVKSPVSDSENIPHQIMLKGRWSLSDDHTLRLTLDKWGRQTLGDRITLEGEILDVNEGSLLFAVTTTTKDDKRTTYVLDLGGSWKADEFNRLSFHIKKETGLYDILTFTGAWEIGKDHQIVYRYEKARLIRKKSSAHALVFKGYWDIKDKYCISYLLDGDTDSAFNFKTSASVFKEGYIKYELGIGSSIRKRPLTKIITLYGRWNLKKNIGLVFDIDYGDKRARALVFGADATLTSKDKISFRLKNGANNKDMGAALELSHKILKGEGEAFLRLLASREEHAIYAGAAWRW